MFTFRWPRAYLGRLAITSAVMTVTITVFCLPFDIAMGRPVLSSAAFLAVVSAVLGLPFAMLLARHAPPGGGLWPEEEPDPSREPDLSGEQVPPAVRAEGVEATEPPRAQRPSGVRIPAQRAAQQSPEHTTPPGR